MKITEKKLRDIVREELLLEASRPKTFKLDLNNGSGAQVYVDTDKESVIISVKGVRNDLEIGLLHELPDLITILRHIKSISK